jgi:hypothetical protein
MHEPLSAEKTAELQKEFPVEEAPVKLTRAQKLERLAELIENYNNLLSLAHNVERYSDEGLAGMRVFGALALATQDAVFLKDGLTAGVGFFSVKDVRDYLELTTGELHEFSCDCGGPITPGKMASRVRGLAQRGPRTPGVVERLTNFVRF